MLQKAKWIPKKSWKEVGRFNADAFSSARLARIEGTDYQLVLAYFDSEASNVDKMRVI